MVKAKKIAVQKAFGEIVAARFDKNKAKRAAQIGVTVISESEMIDFIENGAFPENQTPTRPTHIPDFKTDEITWKERFAPELCFLEYCDNEGQVTQRFVYSICKGTSSCDPTPRLYSRYP